MLNAPMVTTQINRRSSRDRPENVLRGWSSRTVSFMSIPAKAHKVEDGAFDASIRTSNQA